MAADAPARRRSRATTPTPETNAGTVYVILEQVQIERRHLDAPANPARPGDDAADGTPVATFSGGLHGDPVTFWLPLRNERAEHGPDGKLRLVTAASADAAIKFATTYSEEEATIYGGDRRAGTFKAVPLRNWKGGQVVKNKQQIVATQTPLSEDF